MCPAASFIHSVNGPLPTQSSGLNVVATTSSKNHDFVKALGAIHVLDYRDENIENLVATIKETRLELAGAVDAIGEELICRICAEVMKALGGSKVATFMAQEIDNAPEGVAVLGGKLKSFGSGSTDVDL